MAENGEYFNLKLDGRIMNEQPHQSMKFEGLNPGSYKLQVEVATQDQGNVMLKKFAMFEHGTAYKYNIKQKSNGKYVMRLYAMDPINTQPGANMPPPPSSGQPARVQPGFDPNDRPGNTMPSQWDDMGTTSINGANVSMSFMDFTGAGMSVTAGEHGASVSMGDGMGGGVDMSVNATGTGTTTTTTGTHISGGHVGHGQPQMGDCAAPTSDQQFRQLLQSVRGVRNQVTKITQSERLMQEHCLTSRQIKSLLDEIMSVNDRMALAQTGWHWVYDPENYHFTFDAFLSSSRARELQAYMDAHARGGQVAPPPGRRSPGRTEPSRRPPERRQPPPPPTSLVPGYNGPIGCPGPLMNSGQFQNALRSVQDRSFADEQKTVMRQVLRNNCVSVAQVTQMLNAFSFEDDKLEMAKFAFQSTHDIGNFYQLNNAFKFSSSTEKLEAFLSTQPALNQPAGRWRHARRSVRLPIAEPRGVPDAAERDGQPEFCRRQSDGRQAGHTQSLRDHSAGENPVGSVQFRRR